MNHQPQNRRHQAARKFVTALDELETVLHAKSPAAESNDAPSSDHPAPQAGATTHDAEDLGQLLDEAVQDIEHFMGVTETSQDDD